MDKKIEPPEPLVEPDQDSERDALYFKMKTILKIVDAAGGLGAAGDTLRTGQRRRFSLCTGLLGRPGRRRSRQDGAAEMQARAGQYRCHYRAHAASARAIVLAL